MNQFLTQLNTTNDGTKKKIVLPKSDETPIGASEKLVREEIRKLTQNAEEIRKLKEQVDRKDEKQKEEE